MPYIKKFQLDKLTLPSNIFYAPMAGCTDFPQRQITAKFRPGLIFCEMVKMEPLYRQIKGIKESLDFDSSMHPIGAQVCGSNINLAAPCAKIIEDMGFDVLDFNCGCPVRKVVKDGSGAAMLKTPELIGDILATMKNAVKIPVTVKIRIGWDDTSINASTANNTSVDNTCVDNTCVNATYVDNTCVDDTDVNDTNLLAVQITKIAEKAGASAITIHGRTAKQLYKGRSNWNHIKACKKNAKNIKVIGNGDLYTYNDILEMFKYTECDGVMVARGMLKNPAIANNPSDEKYLLEECLLAHLVNIENYWKNEKKIFLKMRQAAFWYLKKIPGTKKLRVLISQTKTPQELKNLVKEQHLWETFVG